MKNLILIIALFICVNGFAQNDTTVIFSDTTTTKYEAELLFESDWIMDSTNFDIVKDSIFPPCRWLRKDSIYVNPNRYRIVEIQKSENAQGIKRRKMRRVRYQNVTRTKRKIKY